MMSNTYIYRWVVRTVLRVSALILIVAMLYFNTLAGGNT